MDSKSIRLPDEVSPFEKLFLTDISFSRLEVFNTCREKYFHSYVEQAERVFGPAAALGKMVHTVLEVSDLTEPFNLLEMHQALEVSRAEHDPDNQVTQELMDVGYDVLTKFVDRHDPEDFNTVATEMPFAIVVGSALIRGYIDRIDRDANGIKICDWKAQPLDTPILTPTGWMKMGDINVGDLVIGGNGGATRVTGVYPQGIVPAYRVTFTDGSTTVCSEEHLWKVDPLGAKEKVLPLNQLGNLRKQLNYKYAIPTSAPIEFDAIDLLPIPPYIMGVFLGDGGTTSGTIKIHNVDDEVQQRVSGLLPVDLKTSYDEEGTWRIASRTRRNRYAVYLRELGLMGLRSWEKFIPEIYLRASIEDRIELLKGLMDTDGCSSTRNDYRTSSFQLRDGVIELCRSLGGVPTSSSSPAYYKKNGKRIDCRLEYIINVRVPFNPFHLTYKATSWTRPKQNLDRRIKSVEHIPDLPMQCIKVEANDGLYVTEDYIVTHNTGKWEVTQKGIADNLQLGIYALACSKFFPGEPIRADLYYLRSGKIKGHSFSTQDLARVEERLLSLVDDLLETTNFNPTGNRQPCRYCDYRLNGLCTTGVRRWGST